MLTVTKHGVLIEKTRLGFENDGVFNPAAIADNGKVHVLYRAVRRGNFSTIGHIELNNPTGPGTRLSHPVMLPEKDFEAHGVEDPRIVKIDDTYYLTYTAYDGQNASGALATSKDLKHFEKQGIIVPRFTYDEYEFCIECCKGLGEKYLRFMHLLRNRLGGDTTRTYYMWDKDVIFFPRKINGKFAFLHRLYPSIQVAYYNQIEDLTDHYWREYLFNLTDYIVMDSKYSFEASYIGGGCPPIETDDGWLHIYHGVEDTPEGYVYHAAAVLLDINDPTKEIARLPEPLFSPSEKWEKEGMVKNVVFPTGTIVSGDELYIYYGAADTRVAVASVKLSELLHTLKNYVQK